MVTLASIFLALYSRLARAQHAGRARLRLRADRQGQGPERVRGGLQARPAQRTRSGGDPRRLAVLPGSCPARCSWRRCSVGRGSGRSRSSPSLPGTRRRYSGSVLLVPRGGDREPADGPSSTAWSIPASSWGSGTDRGRGRRQCPGHAGDTSGTCFSRPSPWSSRTGRRTSTGMSAGCSPGVPWSSRILPAGLDDPRAGPGGSGTEHGHGRHRPRPGRTPRARVRAPRVSARMPRPPLRAPPAGIRSRKPPGCSSATTPRSRGWRYSW